MTGRPVLTAAEMAAAEADAMADGSTVHLLMKRAGAAAAEAIWRRAGPMPALILCGPGNNGGDGYVIARYLAERGVPVTVATYAEPVTEAARAAALKWRGEVIPLAASTPAPLLVDALFGAGLKRGLDADTREALMRTARDARIRVAVDLPSGIAADDGSVLSEVPSFDLTVTFGALKPSHLLQPAARLMGRVVVADIGTQARTRLHEIARPTLRHPTPDDHKYRRGLVTIVAGAMPGASALAATAAARAGAGTVRLQGGAMMLGVPAAVVQNGAGALDRLDDRRIGCLLVGCGLEADDQGRVLYEAALQAGHPLVLDAGALTLLAEDGVERLADLDNVPVLTPHEGEFTKLFGTLRGSKVECARIAAARAQAVVIYKGADTVIADPAGNAVIAPARSHWLATAGTGDVLAGVVAAMRAAGRDAFAAADAAVWLHGRAAELAGPAMIADDLAAHLPTALADCL